MPRLNYGTLLENVVVLESSRLMFDLSPDGARVGFATAFAMPSLTECWCKRVEEANNPWFSYTWLKSLPQRKEAPEGLSQMWSLCLRNTPGLPVRPFYNQEENLTYGSAGPNGALLAAMLAVAHHREIHL